MHEEDRMAKAAGIAESIKLGGLLGVLLLVAASIVLTGCQAARLTYKGAKVRDAFRISLADGTSRSARYQSQDLVVEYEVLRQGSELQISGVAEYTARIRHAYTQIPYFHLRLFLCDQYGNILEDKGITTHGSDDPNNRMRFDETIVLPPGTAIMAFSYNGEARSSGSRQDGGGSVSTFWEIPIAR
jgi:hypothetical protein